MGVIFARKLGHAYGKSGGCRTFPARRRQNFDPQPPLAGRRYARLRFGAQPRTHRARQIGHVPLCRPRAAEYLFEGIEYGEFEPEHIVTVDVADKTLLGSLEPYGDKTDFAIDHHASCRPFAKETWVEGTAGAACELIARLIPALGAEITPKIADCLYTGISTDTGCFRYPNASANTYRIAADLLEHGANAAEINRLMFDTKSRAAVALLKRLYGNMEFHCDGKCAVFCLTNDVIAETGASEDDLDGVSAMVRQVEGVLLGFTLREREGGVWKVSMRATNPADASAVCAKFGGGGHKGAAGCSLTGELEDVKARVVAACGEAIKALENK